MPIIGTIAGASTRGYGGLRSFAPTVPPIAGYYLWYDASDAASISLNGSNVSQWNDKSGNGLHLTQATSTYQPGYTETQNGKNVVTFAADFLYNASVSSPTTATTFAVMNNTTGGSSDQLPICFGSDDTTGSYISYLNFSSPNWRISWEGGSGFGRTFVNLSGQGSYNVWNGRRRSANTDNRNLVNNTGAATATGVTFTTNSSLSLGNYWNVPTGSYPFYGKMAEILVYNSALSDADTTSVYNYLKTKWGL